MLASSVISIRLAYDSDSLLEMLLHLPFIYWFLNHHTYQPPEASWLKPLHTGCHFSHFVPLLLALLGEYHMALATWYGCIVSQRHTLRHVPASKCGGSYLRVY